MHVLQSGLFLTLDFGVSEGSDVYDPLQALVTGFGMSKGLCYKPMCLICDIFQQKA